MIKGIGIIVLTKHIGKQGKECEGLGRASLQEVIEAGQAVDTGLRHRHCGRLGSTQVFEPLLLHQGIA